MKSAARTLDLFITHAWRFHDDWNEAARLLDATAGLQWRNFSLPWHDPAIDPNTALGGQLIRTSLEDQIIPVHGVVFLCGVYAVKSARPWLDLELRFARRHGKPVVALPAFGATAAPEEISARCDAVAAWNGAAIVAALDGVRARATPPRSPGAVD